MKALVTLVHTFETGLRVVAALCLAALLALMLLQVFLRYTAIGVPAFTEETARYAMVWMALMTSAVAVREGSHIRIDFIPSALPGIAPALGGALEFLLDIVTLAICLVILWQGIDVVAFAAGQRSEGLRIPMSWPYVMIPVAFGFAAFFALARLLLRDRLV